MYSCSPTSSFPFHSAFVHVYMLDASWNYTTIKAHSQKLFCQFTVIYPFCIVIPYNGKFFFGETARNVKIGEWQCEWMTSSPMCKLPAASAAILLFVISSDGCVQSGKLCLWPSRLEQDLKSHVWQASYAIILCIAHVHVTKCWRFLIGR